MKCRHPHPAAIGAEQRLDTRPHFFGGLVCKRDGEDLFWLRMAVSDEIGDATWDDARFAGAGSGQDEERTVDVKNCVALFGIQAFEEVQASILQSLTSPGSSVDRRRILGERRCRTPAAAGAAPSESASEDPMSSAARPRNPWTCRELTTACCHRELSRQSPNHRVLWLPARSRSFFQTHGRVGRA